MIEPMPVRRFPRTYLPLALLTVCGPLLGVLVAGDRVRPSVAGLVFVGLLLIGLARGSLVAWLLLVASNAFVMFSIIAASFGAPSLGAPFLILTGLPSLLLLVSPSMLEHVDVAPAH